MYFYNRTIESQIRESLFGGKTIIIYGPRQVGKTTLVQQITKDYGDQVITISGDKLNQHADVAFADGARIDRIVKGKRILVIDEAQRITNIWLHIKILHDSDRDGQIIATGSSSFDLANKISEPLTGRIKIFTLYPLSLEEIVNKKSYLSTKERLNDLLIYGSYPDIIDQQQSQQQDYLDTLTNQYLFKDILAFDQIKQSQKLIDLLRLIALQIGQEVSYSELGQKLWMHQQSIEKYIDLLEKSFVIFRLPSYSTNPRKEITKGKKIYFYDLGIRNSLISNYNPVAVRNDVWVLRENFCIIERLKYIEYNKKSMNRYFWRSRTQQEVDYIEDHSGSLHAFEIKYNSKKSVTAPSQFSNSYDKYTFETITPNTIRDRLQI